jgi:hypothetical protein
MKRATIRRLTTVIGALCVLIIVTNPTPSYSDIATSPVASHLEITAYLAAHPGGTPINDNEISYGGGAFIVTLNAPPHTLGAPDCPLNWFCFYDRTDFGYPRGKLSSCGWQDLATWGWQDRTESVYYNLPGYVVFINHAGGISHANDYPLFTVSAGNRALADVAPYRNMADHVDRHC